MVSSKNNYGIHQFNLFPWVKIRHFYILSNKESFNLISIISLLLQEIRIGPMVKAKLRSLTTPQNRKSQASNMQNHFFNKASIKNPESTLSDKSSVNLYNNDDFCSDSLNELNVAFIAEQSKLLFSDSQSVVSEGLSISGISVIRGNSRMTSPQINFRLEEQFSGLEDWSVQHNITFNKTNLKRPNPSIDQQENEEEIENRCTKRKMNEKMKVLTINPSIKPVQKVTNQGGYMLRSRAKANLASESSSNQELREMINDIEEQEIGAIHNKNKLRLK